MSNRNKKLLALISLSYSLICTAADFQAAGAIDGDFVLVDRTSINQSSDKNKRIVTFTWAIGHARTIKSIEGKKYDSITERAFVDCTNPSVRGVLWREHEFRDLQGRGDPKQLVKEEEFMLDKSSKLQMFNSDGQYSPPRLAADYACAFSDSKIIGNKFNYKIPTQPFENATRLLCTFTFPNGEDLEIPVSFDQKRNIATVGNYAHSVFEISDSQIIIETRDAYDKPSSDKIKISRITGNATLKDLIKGSCIPATNRRF